MIHTVQTTDLAEAIFIDKAGRARREVIEYRVRRGRKGSRSTIDYFCFQSGPGIKAIDEVGNVECRQKVQMTDAEVRAWLETHGKAGDILDILEYEGARREILELMDEFI